MRIQSRILSALLAKREILITFLVVMLIICGTMHPVFALAAFCVCSIAMLFMDNTYFLCLMLLIMPMSTIFKLSPDAVSLFTYLELLYVIWHIAKKRFIISIGELFALLFLAYISITALAWHTIPVTTTIKHVANLMLIGYFMDLDIEEHGTRLFLHYIIGIIACSLIRLMDSSLFPIVKFVALKSENFEMMSVVRFSGLYGDPNYYSVNAIIAMCLAVLLYMKKTINFPLTIGLVSTLLIFVGMTGSKSSFLMLVIPILLMLYACMKNRNYFALFLCVLGFFVVVILVNMGTIQVFDYVLLRLTNTGTSTQDFTTGRSVLWWEYMQFLKRNPLRMIFGTGSASSKLTIGFPHNTYLDFLFQFGILGTLLYFIPLFHFVRKVPRPRKRLFANYSILLVVMIMYFCLSELLYYDFPFHMILMFMVFNSDYTKITPKTSRLKRRCKL